MFQSLAFCLFGLIHYFGTKPGIVYIFMMGARRFNIEGIFFPLPPQSNEVLGKPGWERTLIFVF